MIHIAWEFHVKRGKRKQFEQYYRSSGKWADLFRKSPSYHETILLQDTDEPGRYLLIDVWEDIHSFRKFKQQYGDEYRELDQKCAEFTEDERCLGFFQVHQ